MSFLERIWKRPPKSSPAGPGFRSRVTETCLFPASIGLSIPLLLWVIFTFGDKNDQASNNSTHVDQVSAIMTQESAQQVGYQATAAPAEVQIVVVPYGSMDPEVGQQVVINWENCSVIGVDVHSVFRAVLRAAANENTDVRNIDFAKTSITKIDGSPNYIPDGTVSHDPYSVFQKMPGYNPVSVGDGDTICPHIVREVYP